jgi:hypothetical protein
MQAHAMATIKHCLTFITLPRGQVFLLPAMFSSTTEGTRQHKPGKKQVAMIAQKVVDANQT